MKNFQELSMVEINDRMQMINSFLSIPLGEIIFIALCITVVFTILTLTQRKSPMFAKISLIAITCCMTLLMIDYVRIVDELEGELIALHEENKK